MLLPFQEAVLHDFFVDTSLAGKADFTAINNLYLHAAGLHLRLFVFFDSPNKRRYNEDLLDLYYATRKFLRSAFDVETAGGKVIAYTTNYILQMIIAAAFTLLKLLNSFFAKTIDLDEGKALFTRTISTIREISVTNSDLPSRLAEVLAQLWRGGGAGSRITGPTSGSLDNSLQLKVRCRLSMSLVYDSVWRWREEFQAKGGSLECMCFCSNTLSSLPFFATVLLYLFYYYSRVGGFFFLLLLLLPFSLLN